MIMKCPYDGEILWQWSYTIGYSGKMPGIPTARGTHYYLVQDGGVGEVWAASTSDLFLWLEGKTPAHPVLDAEGKVRGIGQCGLSKPIV